MKNRYPLFITLLFLCTSQFSFAQDSRIWSTYYGAGGSDGGFSVATDHFGNVFLAGVTRSGSGMSFNGFQNSFGGGNVDLYLVKFDSTGARVWATYYGGPGDEMTFLGGKLGIATDDSGNVYLAGLTNSTSGIAANGFQNTIGGTINGFLVKFNAAGNRQWGTYYAGTQGYGYCVATDPAGNVYLTGTTGSSTNISSNGFQNTIGGSSDAYLVKFDRNCNRLWATYYGGTNQDEGWNVTADMNGNVYLAGFTGSTTGIASGGFQNTYGGGSNDAFLVKFDSTGARVWGTYYGGSGDEMMTFAGDIGVATDASGNVFLAGLTTSGNNIASGGFQNSYGGGSSDAFLVKFEATGNRLWGTYYGGSGQDRGYSVSTDFSGNAFLVGRTSSANAIGAGGFQNTYLGNDDAFLVKFNAAGNRLCATYYGGSGVDDCNDVATDDSGNVYLAGGTENVTGIASGGFQLFYGGGTFDAMLIKFTSNCVATDAAEISPNNAMEIFPNPSNGKFTISLPGVTNGQVEVYDDLGQRIYSEHFSQRKEIDLGEIAPGLYYLTLFDGEKVRTEKIVVE